jgi:D-alanyl-D-alanine carboxypeptidase
MESQVLRPLGMRGSTYDPDAVDTELLATPYSRFGRERPNYRFAAQAAAGLYSTADGLALVLKDLLRGYLGAPDAFLETESYRRMLSPVATVDDEVSIGLSFFLLTLEDGSVYAHHGGANRGWKCHFGVNLESSEGMVLLANSDRGVSTIIEPILAAYDEYRAGL